MSVLSVTNTFVDSTTAQASEVNANFSDIVNYVNNRNDGTTAWDALRVTTSSAIVAILDNSSGANDILRCRDNGTVCLAVADGGATTLTATGAATVPLTVNNGTSTGNIFVASDNGTAVLTIADGGVLTYDGAAVFNEAGADVDFRIEGDTVTGLFLVDASADMVSIDSLHIGGTSDPGADNLLVDGTLEITGATTLTGLTKTVAGVHVGGTSDPGTDNLLVDGTAQALLGMSCGTAGTGGKFSSRNSSNTVTGFIGFTIDQYQITTGGASAGGICVVDNMCLGNTPSYGGGTGVFFIQNAGANPGSNPSGGGVLYADAGALKYRGSSGTVTTIANA